ncbi:MAG: UvrD-helicase domain-containing protein [Pirellulales bacterium]
MTNSTTERHQDFTDEQRRAVATRGVSVSLSAGAGCGKTFVLTERYLDHFDPRAGDALVPEEIGQLVAITFTERAAREMRDRIRAKCYERLLEAVDDDAAYWAELLRALDSARISTIHSFCAAILRSRAVEAGVDPQFTVLEQAQAETLLAEAIDDEIRRLVSERDETTLDLAVRFNLDGLREMVRRLSVECTPQDFDEWLAISPDEQVARWEACASELPPVLGRGLAASAPAQTVLEVLRANVPDNDVMRKRRSALVAALAQLHEGPSNRDVLSRCLEAVEMNARVEKTGRAGSWPSEEAYETFRDQAAKLRELAGKLRPVLEFDPRGAREVAVIGGQLLALADGVRRAYAGRKEELRVMDFDDLLVHTRRLLTDEKHRQVVGRLSARVTLLLVDEFQDTDPLQVELVEALAGEGLKDGKLFFVGDYKQSIYRFRGADPHVFRRLRERTPAAGRQSLSLNFRSQPAILHFVNALFWDDLGADYEPLRPHRPQVSPLPAVEFLWAPAVHDGKGKGREKVDQLRSREADWIARRIRAMLDSGEPIVWDAKAAEAKRPAARAAQPGDIAILLRALTSVEAYEAALRHCGIDYYLVGGHAFYAQQEIYDLLNLLRTLNSPADAVSLIGALRSGFFSLADETIFWLAQHQGGISAGLFAGAYPEQIGPDQQERAALAARAIGQLRACKDRLRICELIELALSLTGYDAALLGEFLGERKLANLLKLQEQARGFQRGDFLGLADFITQLAEFVVRQPDEPLAATHSEDSNVVRLMSVHQAKGLEFPIVIVPDVNRKQREPWALARFDGRLGPLVRLPKDDEPVVSGYDLWRHLEKAEEEAETNRLLYVATTRAADYLILSGGVGAVGDANGPWAQLLGRRFDLESGRFIGRLPAGETGPSVKVTTEEPPIQRGRTAPRTKANIAAIISGLEQAAAAPGGLAKARAIDPIPPDPNARRQYSFSRLQGTLRRKYERLDQAEFAGEASHDPRSLGTLVHAALAAIDFAAPGDCRELVERIAEQHLPDNPGEVDEAVAMVERFVASERAREIVAAREAHAEVEFLLGWPPDGQDPGQIVLRGFIDRLYQDAAGRWHLLDFKTNRVSDKGIAAHAADYEMQMLVYGLAAERILGSAPATLTLHFLRTGEEHPFDWNDAARRKVITLVNDAIGLQRIESQGSRQKLLPFSSL